MSQIWHADGFVILLLLSDCPHLQQVPPRKPPTPPWGGPATAAWLEWDLNPRGANHHCIQLLELKGFSLLTYRPLKVTP